MNKFKTIVIFIAVCILALALPGVAAAQTLPAPPTQTISGDQLVIGNNYTLKSGQTLNGSLVILGGNAIVESGAKINGDIALFGGNLDFAGEVSRNISVVGGNVSLHSGSIVRGDIDTLGGSLTGENLATIYGQVRRMTPRAFNFPRTTPSAPTIAQRGLFNALGDFLGSLLSRVLQVLGMAVLALVLALIIPKPMDRVANSLSNQPWLSVGTGVLTLVVGPIILVLLSITIILIPFTLLTFIALGLAIILGWVAFGYEVGKRMMVLFKTEWADSVSAGLGTVVLGVAVWLLSYVPCLGWLAGVIVASLGLGGVILSRFGTQYYMVKSTAPSTPPSTPVVPPSATPSIPAAPSVKAPESSTDQTTSEKPDEPSK